MVTSNEKFLLNVLQCRVPTNLKHSKPTQFFKVIQGSAFYDISLQDVLQLHQLFVIKHHLY